LVQYDQAVVAAAIIGTGEKREEIADIDICGGV
jgi:hypothetical protein